VLAHSDAPIFPGSGRVGSTRGEKLLDHTSTDDHSSTTERPTDKLPIKARALEGNVHRRNKRKGKDLDTRVKPLFLLDSVLLVYQRPIGGGVKKKSGFSSTGRSIPNSCSKSDRGDQGACRELLECCWHEDFKRKGQWSERR